MSTEPTGPATIERGDLEQTHHDLCTALTIVRSRGDLLRRHLECDPDPARHVAGDAHVTEIDKAVDRLQGVALDPRTWHSGQRILKETFARQALA